MSIEVEEVFTPEIIRKSPSSWSESLAKFYLQNWKDVGLHVELVDGRLLEFNSFYDRVQKDDPGIDIFGGAWGTGSDVDPGGLYGRGASFNYSRLRVKRMISC